jgi:hypothetical protein
MFIPDPGSDFFPSWIRIFSIQDPRSTLKNLSIFNPKNCFLSSRKYDPGCSSRILLFTHPVSRIQGSKRHRIRNTAFNCLYLGCTDYGQFHKTVRIGPVTCIIDVSEKTLLLVILTHIFSNYLFYFCIISRIFSFLYNCWINGTQQEFSNTL